MELKSPQPSPISLRVKSKKGKDQVSIILTWFGLWLWLRLVNCKTSYKEENHFKKQISSHQNMIIKHNICFIFCNIWWFFLSAFFSASFVSFLKFHFFDQFLFWILILKRKVNLDKHSRSHQSNIILSSGSPNLWHLEINIDNYQMIVPLENKYF